MEPLFIAVAFACGMLVNLVGLPPLIGFLAAGFVLNGLGYQSSEVLTTVAELGVTLMLFTIGLKLNIKTLLPVTCGALPPSISCSPAACSG